MINVVFLVAVFMTGFLTACIFAGSKNTIADYWEEFSKRRDEMDKRMLRAGFKYELYEDRLGWKSEGNNDA